MIALRLRVPLWYSFYYWENDFEKMELRERNNTKNIPEELLSMDLSDTVATSLHHFKGHAEEERILHFEDIYVEREEDETVLRKAVTHSHNGHSTFVKEFQSVKESSLGADPTITYHAPAEAGIYDILVVEEDEMSRQILSLLLRRNYLTFKFAHSPEEASEKYVDDHYRLMLVGTDNPEILHKGLSELLQKSKVPVLAMKTKITKDQVTQFINTGFADVVAKPYTEDQLLKYLHANMKDNTYEKNETTDQSSSKTGDTISLDQLKRIGNSDTEFLLKMLDKFIISVQECSEALEAALPEKNWQQMRQAAHKSIPSFSLMGVTNMLQDLEFIEHQSNEESKQEEVLARAENVLKKNKKIIADVHVQMEALRNGKTT